MRHSCRLFHIQEVQKSLVCSMLLQTDTRLSMHLLYYYWGISAENSSHLKPLFLLQDLKIKKDWTIWKKNWNWMFIKSPSRNYVNVTALIWHPDWLRRRLKPILNEMGLMHWHLHQLHQNGWSFVKIFLVDLLCCYGWELYFVSWLTESKLQLLRNHQMITCT